MRDLLREPLWQAEDLGRAIPDDPHGVSVCLPRWLDCVGYEEGDPTVLGRLQSGYPRFVFHPVVRRLFERVDGRSGGPGWRCQVMASRRSALRCAAYLRAAGVLGVDLVVVSEAHGAWAVRFPEAAAHLAKQYWQHTGEGITSRCAAAVLAEQRPPTGAGVEEMAVMRARLAGWYRVPVENVLCYANGMAAIAAVNRLISHSRPGCRSLQVGFPYVDLLKVQERCGSGAELLAIAGDDLNPVSLALQREEWSACVIETPGNPLLGCVDVPQLSDLLRQASVPLVVDDTLAGPLNVDLAPYADVIVTSLTKYITGSGTVMGGAAIINPASPQADRWRRQLTGDHETEAIWWQDLLLLEAQSRDYPQRLRQINQTAAALVERLRQHPAIARVRYPDADCRQAYDRIRRPDGGYGGLLSLELHQAETRAPAFYDALQVSKGPSLGTDYTLACPFTILAHYHELDWAEAHGVSRYLVRVSVGLEDLDDLWQRFSAALP